MTVKKSYDFVHLHKSSLYASEDIARGVEKKLDALDVIHRSALTGVASIRNSKDLTPKGKQSALDELADKLQRQTKEWQDSHTHYSDYAEQLEREMQPKRSREDDIVGELRQAEIRGYLRTLDPLDVEVEYLAAAERNDYLFLDAIENSPKPFRFATEGLVKKMSFVRLEKAYPEQAQTLKDVRFAQEEVRSALKSARADLRKHSIEIVPEDTVGLQAA